MSEHFIKNIEIKDFKCFKDFKAKGFGRVNLIGGKNNVGKTAFMEACYLSQSENTEELFSRLLEIKTHRDVINSILSKTTREEDLQKLIKESIGIDILIKQKIEEAIEEKDDRGHTIDVDYKEWSKGYTKIELKEKINVFTKNIQVNVYPPDFATGQNSFPNSYTFSELINLLNISLNSTKYQFSLNYISPYSNSNNELENIIGQSKLDGKYDKLNEYLKDVFNISNIDIIKNKPMLKSNGKYNELSSYGQGIKTFINTISSILLLKDDMIFIDEIENGIHYTHFDKLWELILTISKEQNVQVFATTHSKECIESFNRVQKNLNHDDCYYFEMFKNLKKNTIEMSKLDSKQLEYELSHNGGFRGE